MVNVNVKTTIKLCFNEFRGVKHNNIFKNTILVFRTLKLLGRISVNTCMCTI